MATNTQNLGLSEMTPTITVRYQSIDHFSKTRKFKTLAGAQKFAQKWVGKTPEVSLGFQYAVSGDGVGKITCSGCLITKLFPSLSNEASGVVTED